MGVNGLMAVITDNAPGSIGKKQMSSYRGTVQGIDASHLLYKSCMARSDVNINANCHLETCLHKNCTMLKYGILPRWIFDGKAPNIKSHTMDKRRAMRDDAVEKLSDPNISEKDKIKYSKLSITLQKNSITDVKILLELMGLQYSEADGEADAECAALNVANVTNGVVSEDWDMLLFGCEKLLKNFFDKSHVVEIDSKILLRELGMNLEQLIDLSALLGNDYCPGIIGLKPLIIFKKFKECKFDIYVFLDVLRKDKVGHVPSKFVELWLQSKKYYMEEKFIIKKDAKQILWTEPKYKQLYEFLVNDKKFDAGIVNSKINELKQMYTYYSVKNQLGAFNVVRRMKL